MLCLFVVLFEWAQRTRQYALDLDKLPIMVRWMIYYAAILSIVVYGSVGENEFIYFQF